MKQLLFLILMLSSILVSAQTSQSKRADTTTRAEIRLPSPAGGMTVEVVRDTLTTTRREQCIKVLKMLMERHEETEPYVSIVLGCLISHMYMNQEGKLADDCIRLTSEMIRMNRSSQNQ